MKKSIALLLFIVTSTIYAQNSGITYQAVIYNPSTEILPGNNNPNVVLANKEICLRFSIKDAASSLEYQEVQKVKTDEFGMVNLVVGQGNQISGYAANFGVIVWNSSNKTLAVAIDANANCSNFIEVSEQFFSAVPFAYASKVAETVSGIVPIVNGGTGAATVAGAKTNLGLNNVDNTSDLNKPVSTATQNALDAKAPLASPGFTGVPTAPTAPTGTSTTQIATTAFVNAALATAAAPDATITLKGRIQLAGDLSGTADAPTVPALANKENLANKSTDMVADANSTTKYPSVKLIKDYVDSLTSSGVADADSTTKGKIQLAGDLAGTSSSAANPIISNDAISTVKIADGAVTTSKINDVSVTETKLAANAVTTNKIVDGTIAAIDLATNSVTTDKITDASVTETKLATNAITTAKMIDGAVTTPKIADNAVTNAKIGGVVAVNKGGTGSDMSNAGAGYVKQATSGAVFTTVSTIPVADVTGAVRKVNGVVPDANGNVAVIIGRVFTGATVDPNLATSIISASPAKQQSDIYIVADGNNPNNGRTFIYDGTNWLEVATDLSATDARYVNVAGDTMEGNLTIPTGKKIIITDLPSNATDATNKEYVDTKIGGSGTTNYVPKFSAAKTLTDSSIFDNGTNVGIGTASPANKLEITQGTAGNSGLRFTNLTASSAATTASSKVLGVNNNGDVILTNVPGTQNIVDFSTATPTTSGVVFTPNTPLDESVVYQSSVDNSMWTYNGTTYVTYTPPASTAWFTAGTTNDAGNSKTSNIYRTGRVGIGTNNPTTNLDVVGGFNLRNTAGAAGSNFGMEFNTNSSSPRIDWVYNGNYTGSFAGDADFFFRLQNSRLGAGGFRFMTNPSGTAVERMTILNNGNIGMGITAPVARLHIQGIQATLGANANATMLRMSRPTWSGNKWGSAAQFNLGTYVDGGNNVDSKSRLDLALTNINDETTFSNVMTWLANGNVGIRNTAPTATLDVNSSTVATNTVNADVTVLKLARPLNSGVKVPNIAHFNLGSFTTGGQPNSRLDLNLSNTTEIDIPNVMTWQANGNVGINTTSPSTPLVVQANTVGTGVLKLAVPSVGTDNWWMGFSHGINNSPDSNDRARIGVDIASGGAGRLFFTTGGPGAQTRAMFIDQNQRVGIGTSTPTSRLDVVSSTTEVARFTTSLSTTNYAGIGIGNASGAWGKIAAGEGKFQIRNFTTDATIINAELGTGNVGIGTTSPTSRLEVNGSATNSVAFNSGSATAILFNNSNLAYTSASPTAFFLQGIKDGGTYTLAVQGTTSGTASFSAVGFTFKSINNGTTIAGKDTLYTFVVMGTTVYVYMATGF